MVKENIPIQKAPMPPRTRRSVSFIANKPIIVAPRKNFLPFSHVGNTCQKNRQQIFETLIKGATAPHAGATLAEIEAQASKYLFARFRLAVGKMFDSNVAKCGASYATVMTVANNIVALQARQRVGKQQDLEEIICQEAPARFAFARELEQVLYLAIEYADNARFQSPFQVRVTTNNKIWASPSQPQDYNDSGFKIDMVADKRDYIGTMISGFGDVEVILQFLADISNEKYVSTQTLFQAVLNGYINPESVFERKQLLFTSHQPAEEGLEDNNDDGLFEDTRLFVEQESE